MQQTWVVTGANRGLGLELARQLAEREVRVVGTARAGADVAALRATGAEIFELDVRDEASAQAFARALGERPVDVLVNNAGRQYRPSSLEELEEAELKDLFAVNTFGPLWVTRALLPRLRAGGRKLVVHVTSRMGCFGEFTEGNMFGYRASKAALNMFHRCVADELVREGIVCVALHPGWVRTEMGGPQATLSAAESVAGMLRVIEELEPEDNGALFGWDGELLPW